MLRLVRLAFGTLGAFLRNQAKGIVAVDLFTVPTVRFEVLYVFVVMALERRFSGTISRELFDHVIVVREAHGRRLLREFQAWYKEDRVHLVLAKDTPDGRPVEAPEMGGVVSLPRPGGLHHRCSRRAA